MSYDKKYLEAIVCLEDAVKERERETGGRTFRMRK